ncbi:MAG TPA: isochorismatase family protein [Devosia sp.]|nr:isochorismatase family protein [Devosia sp.]
MPDTFPTIAANPYAWPFDGQWNGGDTALLLLGFQKSAVADLTAQNELAVAVSLADLARGLGIAVLASQRGLEALVSELAMYRSEAVQHRGDNAFFGTQLEANLRRRGIRNLLIAGLPTDGLVHATQRTANDMGFECLLVSDASKATSPARHTAQLRMTTFGNGLFGAVADSAAILAALAISGNLHHA